MAIKSVLQEAKEIHLAIDLIKLGARTQVLEAETGLKRVRLYKLYKDIKGCSPPRGMLPYEPSWFVTWLSCIHASMFYNTYHFMITHGSCTRLDALMKSYRLYLEQVELLGVEVVLDFTRAWTLTRFIDNDMLRLSACTRCTGLFVAHPHERQASYVCVLCKPPGRSGILQKTTPTALDDSLKEGVDHTPIKLTSPTQWLSDVVNTMRH
jgi:flagellar transcriptional activator FlhC